MPISENDLTTPSSAATPDIPDDTTARPDEVPHLTVPHAVTPFFLGDAPVRGRLVRLGPLADALLSRHSHLPYAVRELGGQALALVAAMATALKFSGSFSLQIKGDGPVSLFLADCTNQGGLRFTACMAENHDQTVTQEDPLSAAFSAKDLLGKGYLAFTVDQGDEMERHQGIVEIQGETLTAMAQAYFETSEQHACAIHLFTQKDDGGHWQAGALILERIAGYGGSHTSITGSNAADNDDLPTEHQDLWETACAFGATLKGKELFDPALSNRALVQRLFGTLDVHISESRPLSYGCRCHRKRLGRILERFSEDDLDHMTENGVISMDCGFCNVKFRFRRNNIKPVSHQAIGGASL